MRGGSGGGRSVIQRDVWIVTLKVACRVDGGWDTKGVEREIATAVDGEEVSVLEVDAQCAEVEKVKPVED
jgi:hypothetical protein